MMRGALRPASPDRSRFGAALQRYTLAPAPAVLHNPLGAIQSGGMLLNDTLSDCVVVSALRYCQRWDTAFAPTDDMARQIFAACGSPPDGLDPFDFMDRWQAGKLPVLPSIAGWVQLDISNGTQLTQSIVLTKGAMLCAALAEDAEDRFPAPWVIRTLGDPGQDGHCFFSDGFDQTGADVLLDRTTWADYTQGGINLAFLAEFGFAGIAAIRDPAVMTKLREIAAL